MGTKKLPEDIAIKRRSVLVLLISLGLFIKGGIDFLSFDIDRWIIGGIIFFVGLVLFVFQWMQIRYFYCPKCKSQCDWKTAGSRIDDLTTRRKDGQVDRRYSSVLVRWFNFEYNCRNKDCGYKFTEWQRENTGPTWTEIQKFDKALWQN